MPPADRIREHNEQDPGRVAHTRQEAGPSAVGPALRILQLNVEGLSAAKRSTIRDIAERHNVVFTALVKQINNNSERKCAENYNKWHNTFFLNCNRYFGNFKP